MIEYFLLKVFSFNWFEIIKNPRTLKVKGLFDNGPLEFALNFGLIEARLVLFLELEEEKSISSEGVFRMRVVILEILSHESPQETGFPWKLTGGVNLQPLHPQTYQRHLEGQPVWSHKQ